MTQPNIVNVAEIHGFSISGAITTSDVDIITVDAEEVWKINTFMISNTDGTNACHVSIKVRTDGSNFREIGPGIPIPPRTVLTFIDKNTYENAVTELKTSMKTSFIRSSQRPNLG